VVELLVQPVVELVNEYVTGKVPTPETEGLKVLPLTPVPLNVPPAGDPVRVNAGLILVTDG
jgi:hypothetical protein